MTGTSAIGPSTPPGAPVWLSSAFYNTNVSRSFLPYPPSPVDRPAVSDKMAALSLRIKRGQPIGEGEIPRDFYNCNGWAFDETLPPMILISMPALRPELAAIFERFDLGAGRLHPVDLIENDRQTLISRDYRLLTPGNPIETLELVRSPNLRIRVREDGSETFMFTPPSDGATATFLLKPGFSCAPDIWMDPRLLAALFLSDRLVQALRVAGMDRFFRLTRCIHPTRG